ncbi:hypothetical protein FNV43_RR09754 [Rhamnella rubrinervis]|uniref:DUF3527 domain protein n=1 Tax=Rhamnella rubrinervis TaxID=2594499 RepID=A0A8K0MKN5_9ROSA|nr:hypothetical protein FNV43_RR09754 [Rhamnella rubrinervis]
MTLMIRVNHTFVIFLSGFRVPERCDVHSTDDLLEPAASMGFSSEQKNSCKQQSDSKTVKNTVPSPHRNQVSKHQDRLKVKNHVDLRHSDQHSDLTLDAAKKYSGNQHWQTTKGNDSKHGELVKYMSNLPGYLQSVDRRANLQGKALNVGVLDWARLEKWKSKHKNCSDKGSNTASCSTSNSSSKRITGLSASSNAVHVEKSTKQHPSVCSSLVSSRKDDLSRNVQRPFEHVCFQDSETASKKTISGQKHIPRRFKSFDRGHSGVILEKEKIIDVDQQQITSEMSVVSKKFKDFGVSLSPKGNMSSCGKAKKTKEELQEKNIKTKSTEKKIVSESVDLALKLESCDFSVGSKEKKSIGSYETKKIVEDLHELYADVAQQHQPGKDNATSLLLPNKLPQEGFPEALKLSQPNNAVLDKGNEESNKIRYSDRFSTEEINSAELCPEISHCCPLPCVVETCSTSDVISNSDLSMELSSDASYSSQFSDKSQDLVGGGKYAARSYSEIKLRNFSFDDTSKTLDQEIYELAVGKGGNPSPTHRFSFSLGRLGRSLSFKERLAVPQLSSTHVTVKSGPVCSNASDSVDYLNRDKANGHNRARASPFRRLLDPILKHKEAHRRHSSETVLPLKGSFINSLSSVPIHPSHNEKRGTSWVQALLQLTIKNGLPLFKFEVFNSSSIVASMMKNLSSGKDDLDQNYTFYSVNEVKKKGSVWISQGSKEKSCGYVYNIAGQMRVSNSDFFDSGQDSSLCLVRESVLVGVELKQADQESPKSITNRELAAAIVRIPRKNLFNNDQQTDESLMEKGNAKCLPENQGAYNLGEHDHLSSTTVILPGGVHSSPNKGEPSPLLDRWKSGGSCDCGGWDVGCKLRVLSNKNKCSRISETSKAGQVSDRFELFVQGETEQNRPVFSLVPLKDGIYRIEFNASITRLQAFFICVAIMSSQKPSHLLDASNMSEEKAFKQPDLDGNDRVQAKMPSKFAPNPPLSPFGRV